MQMNESREVAILIFDDVEILDFCGPFEVFSVTGRPQEKNPFKVYTVAEKSPVLTRGHLSVNSSYTLDECPQPDILVIPGGSGTRREMHNQPLIKWIKDYSEPAELVLSVCTGALLLAKAGLLEGLTATTHHGALDLLKEVAPNTTVQYKRFIDNGRIILAAGISAGIDMALYVVTKLLGEEQAIKTAQQMEYEWKPKGIG